MSMPQLPVGAFFLTMLTSTTRHVQVRTLGMYRAAATQRGAHMMACRLTFLDHCVPGRSVLVSRISLAFPLDRRLTVHAEWDGSQLVVRALCAGTPRMTFDLAACGSVRKQLMKGHANDSDDVANAGDMEMVLASGDVANSLRRGILCVLCLQFS